MSTNETIDLYEGLITKPTLTEQLLSRPPFKFILDIVSNVIKSTGYLKDEFGKDELAAAGTDKTSKVAFLDKLISLLDSGDLGNVKSAKIIAGKDPDDTNKLLQKLAKNAKSSGGGEKEKKKKSKDKEKEPKEKKSSSKDKEKSSERKSKRDSVSESSDEKKKEKRDKSKSKDEKEKSTKKSSSSSKERHKSKEKKSSPDEKSKSDKKKKDKVLKRGDSMIAINGDDPHTPNEEAEQHDEGYDEQEGPSSNVMMINDSVDSSSLLQQATSPVKTDDSGMGDDSPRPPPPSERAALLRQATGAARPQTSMGRPGTAASRPAPPKIKKKQIATIDSAPQPVIELKSEIITDGQTTKDDNDNNFVMEEDEIVEVPTLAAETVDEEDRGALVQKIMEKKAELEDGATANQNLDDGNETTAVERERVKQLQDKLQDLTKTAYPLARLFDFANDDIETMIKELERWRLEQRKNEQEEQNKKAAGLGDSSRLYEMIANLQRDIKDVKDELSAARGRVLANEDRIKLLVSNI